LAFDVSGVTAKNNPSGYTYSLYKKFADYAGVTMSGTGNAETTDISTKTSGYEIVVSVTKEGKVTGKLYNSSTHTSANEVTKIND
jgi:hypothetical protein